MSGDLRPNVGGAMLWGATAAWFNKGLTLDDNPYPDMPGFFVFRKAWAHGFKNSEAVLREADGDDDL